MLMCRRCRGYEFSPGSSNQAIPACLAGVLYTSGFAMTSGTDQPVPRRRKGCLKGCLVALLLGGACIAFFGYRIGEPSRRARRVHQSIRPGMSVGDVESLLTGRYYCSYKMKRGADWETVYRDEFLAASVAPEGDPRIPRRIWLVFMGPSPFRVSFYVEIDERGLASGATDPRGWD
jgi:hypothetical protein